MYSGVTADFKTAIEDDARKISLKFDCTIGNTTTTYTADNIISMDISGSSSAQNELTMGATCARQMELVVCDSDNVAISGISWMNAVIKPYVGLEVNGSFEWVPMGLFYVVETPTRNRDYTVKIVAYDGFALMGTEYATNILVFPANIQTICADICTFANVALDSTYDWSPYSNADYDITPNGGTCREIIGHIAGLMGTNAMFNRDGELTFGWFGQTPLADRLDITPDLQYLSELEVEQTGSIVVQTITSGYGDIQYTSPENTSGYGFTFENPYMTQTILNTIFADRITGGFYTYVPLTAKWRGNPVLDLMDDVVVTLDDGTTTSVTPVMVNDIHVRGGLYGNITAKGASEYGIGLNTGGTLNTLKRRVGSLSTAMGIIEGANGGIFEITDRDGDGVNDGWIIKENNNVPFSGKCIVATYEGIGFSADGGNTGTTAILTDGGIKTSALVVNSALVPFDNYVSIGSVDDPEGSGTQVAAITISNGTGNTLYRLVETATGLYFLDSADNVVMKLVQVNGRGVIQMGAFGFTTFNNGNFALVKV